MKYRAILSDPGNLKQERPVQILSNSKSDVDDWAARKLEAAISPLACVKVFEIQETQIELKTKAERPA